MGPKGSQPKKNTSRKQDENRSLGQNGQDTDNQLYCSEEDSEKEKEEETGYNHQVLCTNEGCKIWTDIWLPKKIDLNVLKRPFLCGFCAAERIKLLVSENHRLNEQLQKSPKDTQRLYADITKQIDNNLEKVTNKVAEIETKLHHNTNEKIALSAYSLQTEQQQQAKKAKNVVLFGTTPDTDENDVKIVKKVHSVLNLDVNFQCKRIGRINNAGKQLLLIRYEDENSKRSVLRSAKLLRNNEDTKEWYIRPDMTKNEQELMKKLVVELKDKREKEKDKTFFISNGRIIELRK